MDPTQALSDALRSLAQHDKEEAAKALEALTVWLASGGFSPSVSEALRRACLDDLGLAENGQPHPAVSCPSYWKSTS